MDERLGGGLEGRGREPLYKGGGGGGDWSTFKGLQNRDRLGSRQAWSSSSSGSLITWLWSKDKRKCKETSQKRFFFKLNRWSPLQQQERKIQNNRLLTGLHFTNPGTARKQRHERCCLPCFKPTNQGTLHPCIASGLALLDINEDGVVWLSR